MGTCAAFQSAFYLMPRLLNHLGLTMEGKEHSLECLESEMKDCTHNTSWGGWHRLPPVSEEEESGSNEQQQEVHYESGKSSWHLPILEYSRKIMSFQNKQWIFKILRKKSVFYNQALLWWFFSSKSWWWDFREHKCSLSWERGGVDTSVLGYVCDCMVLSDDSVWRENTQLKLLFSLQGFTPGLRLTM